MRRIALLISNEPLEKKRLEKAFSNILDRDVNLSFDGYRGSFEMDSLEMPLLDRALFPLHNELGANISILICHKEYDLSSKLLNGAIAYFPNQTCFMSDLLYREISFGDYSSFPMLAASFRGLDKEILLTVGSFLRNGLNAIETADALYIHRNTFNYRLKKFNEITSLDIRDYHDALLLELYFQFSSTYRHY